MRVLQRVGKSKLDIDAWKRHARSWRAALPYNARPHAHELLDAIDLARVNADAALASWPSLKVVDRHVLAADNQESSIGLAQPVVQTRCGDTQAMGRFAGVE